MKIKIIEDIKVKDIFKNYKNEGEDGGVVGWCGNLNIRPAYQREYIYIKKKIAMK